MTDNTMVPQLCDLPIREFLDVLAAGTPTPGGGSAAALAGAEAGALLVMVSRITLARAPQGVPDSRVEEILTRVAVLQVLLTELIDLDAAAYQGVLAAYRLPKVTANEKTSRFAAIQTALMRATEVPLQTSEACAELLALSGEVGQRSIPGAATDAAVAALLAHAGLRGAALNVAVNLENVKDTGFCSRADERLDALLAGSPAALASALSSLNRGE